jgi:hypothetical protein
MAGYIAKGWYVGDGEDGVYFTVKKNAADRYWVKAVVEDATAYHTGTLMVPGTYATEKDAVKAGVEAAIEWCRKHACMDGKTAADVLTLF